MMKFVLFVHLCKEKSGQKRIPVIGWFVAACPFSLVIRYVKNLFFLLVVLANLLTLVGNSHLCSYVSSDKKKIACLYLRNDSSDPSLHREHLQKFEPFR